MHELFLCAEVKADQLQSALSILQGYCAMPPIHIIQRRLIYKGQRRPPQGAPPLGMSRTIMARSPPPRAKLWKELHNYMTQQAYIISVSYDASYNEYDSTKFFRMKPEESDKDLNSIPGGLLFHEIPEPAGPRPVSSRKIVLIDGERDLPSAMTDSPNGFGYSFLNEHIADIYRFIHDDVTFTIFRCLLHPDDAELVGRPSITGSPRLELPPFETLRPFDQADGWVMKASLKVEDGSKPADMQTATDILVKIKADLAGSFELSVPDRFSLDTRA